MPGFKVTGVPEQMVWLGPRLGAGGDPAKLTTDEAVAWHPAALVTVTVYVPGEVGAIPAVV